jgi:hypothetical protein
MQVAFRVACIQTAEGVTRGAAANRVAAELRPPVSGRSVRKWCEAEALNKDSSTAMVASEAATAPSGPQHGRAAPPRLTPPPGRLAPAVAGMAVAATAAPTQRMGFSRPNVEFDNLGAAFVPVEDWSR